MHAFNLLLPVTALVAATLAQAQPAEGLERRIVLTPELAQQIEANGGFRRPLGTINGRPLSIKMAGRGLGADAEDDAELARRFYLSPEQLHQQQLVNGGGDQSIYGVRPLSAKPGAALDAGDDEAAKLARRIVITPEMQQQLAAEGKTAPYFPQLPPIGPNHIRPQVLRRREYDVEPQRRLASNPPAPEHEPDEKQRQEAALKAAEAVASAFAGIKLADAQKPAARDAVVRSPHPLS